MVNNLFDNRFALTYHQANEIIDSFWNNLNIEVKKTISTSMGMSFTVVYEIINIGKLSIFSERGYINYEFKIKETKIDLLKYEPLLNKIEVTSKKNVLFPVFRTRLKKTLYPPIYRGLFCKMGVPHYICAMFLRKKKNNSGSVSVQIISKSGGRYKVIKTIGSGKTEQEIQKLWYLGEQEMERLSLQPKLFVSKNRHNC